MSEKYFSRDNLELVMNGLKAEMVPNWNENDSDALGYINNRTHYEEITELFSIENAEFTDGRYINETPFIITDGNTYVVNWDGTEYTCAAYVFNGLPAIGDTSFLDGKGNGEPFAIGYDNEANANFIVALNDSIDGSTATHTFSVVGNLVHTINPKYLPKLVGKNVTGVKYTIDDETMTAGAGAEIFNAYYDNIASGNYSHAEGSETTASGDISHAEGSETTASGTFSHAEGFDTTADAQSSHAEGGETAASGACSHAEGSNTAVANSNSVTATTTTVNSKGYAGHAEGYGTVSYGRCSHAEGNGTTASGCDSHAEGYKTTASGDISHAEGKSTIASGHRSHAEGANTFAGGKNSHAEGSSTEAKGINSHAEGFKTLATRLSQHVQGRYNIEDPGGGITYDYDQGKYAHIVGNGTDEDARSNAHTLDWEGNAWFAGDVYVGGTSQDEPNAVKLLREDNIPSMILKNNHGMPIQGWWREIAYGNGVAVAVNYAARTTISAVYSTDGLFWTKSNLPNIARWISVSYVNEMFIATSNTDKAAYSTDGIDWTIMTLPQSKIWSKVAYGNGMFVMIACGDKSQDSVIAKSDVAIYSTDGITWTETKLPASAQWIDVCYGNGKFIAINQNNGRYMAYSTDGITWTETTFAQHISALYRIIYENNVFVASGYGYLIYSYDGISWSNASKEISGLFPWVLLTYVNGKFITIDITGTRLTIQQSVDGVTWTTIIRNVKGLPIGSLCDIEYINNKFILTGRDTDYIAYSTDLINWHTVEKKQIIQNNEDITEQAQADWNQNDETAPDYVKNRTHYEYTEFVEILPETELTGEDQDGMYGLNLDATLFTGNESQLTVTFDGTEYVCDALTLDDTGAVYFGNISKMGAGDDTGEPFFIGVMKEINMTLMIMPDTEVHTVIINGLVTNYKVIDANYLPRFAGKKVTGTEYTINDEIVTAGNGAEIFNDYKDNIASGAYSHAEGGRTTASGHRSHAEGGRTTASGDYSHAEGKDTTASGAWSHAENSGTIASGNTSHAEGSSTEAFGYASHAEGQDTTAYGGRSHAEGNTTIAYGDHSHAEGRGNRYSVNITGDANATTYTVSSVDNIHNGMCVRYNSNFAMITSVDTTNKTITLDKTISDVACNEVSAGIYPCASGDYSHVEGNQTTASGESSHAEGIYSIASGHRSHVEGYRTTASGNDSHAEGHDTKATGESSHAEGINAKASGNESHAEGCGTTAYGDHSHAEGIVTIAYGANSHAEGSITIAYGVNSHAEGSSTIAYGNYSHAEGYNTMRTLNISGNANVTTYTVSSVDNIRNGMCVKYDDNVAMITSVDTTNKTITLDKTISDVACNEVSVNIYTGASGMRSHAEGTDTIAYGAYSHAEGSNTTASGTTSHAEGSATTASGISSHAEGSFATASGSDSHAEGYRTVSSSICSHAEGNATTASGGNSHAEGVNTIAAGTNQHAQGKYNIEDTDNAYAHIVGNGSSSARSNAHTLDWDGNAWFAGDVYVGSTSGTNKDEGSVKLSKEGHTHTWDEVTNKPFVEVGGDTLTWDGNTEGLVSVAELFYYKVSDVIPTKADFANGATFGQGEDDGMSVDGETLQGLFTDDGFMDWGSGAIVPIDNYTFYGLTFPESGIYFIKATGDFYAVTDYLTIPGYTGFAKEQIDPKVLPEALQFGETTVQGDTLTWDGNTEGLVSDNNGIAYKVSDAVFSAEDCANGVEATLNIGTGECTVVDMGGVTMIIVDGEMGAAYSVPAECVGVDFDGIAFPKAGVYFANIPDAYYCTSLTIPGYSGFTKTEIKPIEEKFIPDTVPTIQSATVGQTIRVSAVDENGVPTAWEAFDPFVLTDESTGTKYKLTVVDSKLTMTEVTV